MSFIYAKSSDKKIDQHINIKKLNAMYILFTVFYISFAYNLLFHICKG